MSKIVVVTGVPGSGKSTVIKRVLDELKSKGVDYNFLNYGDVMLGLMSEKESVSHRDDLRKVPIGRYREIQREAAKQIARAAEKRPVLLDTHCLIKKPEGYYPGLPRWVLEELNPDLIIIVEAKPEEIAGRRTRGVGRLRDKDLTSDIEEHQQLNRAAASAYAAISGVPVKIIQNSDKGLRRAVEEVVSVMG